MQETDSQSQEQATATKAASAPAKSRTLWGDAFKRLRKNKLAVIGVCWIIIVVLVALTADQWAKPWLGSPTASDSTTMAETSLLAPCAEHPFGTDALGRDILVRVIYGARVSLSVGIMATAISTLIGLVIRSMAPTRAFATLRALMAWWSPARALHLTFRRMQPRAPTRPRPLSSKTVAEYDK